jgi:hypothetical protein
MMSPMMTFPTKNVDMDDDRLPLSAVNEFRSTDDEAGARITRSSRHCCGPFLPPNSVMKRWYGQFGNIENAYLYMVTYCIHARIDFLHL